MRITQSGIAVALCGYDWHNNIVYPSGPRDDMPTLLPISTSASEEFPGGRVFPSRLASMAATLEYEGLGLFAFFGYYMTDGCEWDLLDEDVAHRIRGVDDLNQALGELDDDYYVCICGSRRDRWVALVIAPLPVIG